MTILTGLGLLGGAILVSLFVYLLVRLVSAAYFKSKLEHETMLSYAYFKKTFGFDRRKTTREVPREAEK